MRHRKRAEQSWLLRAERWLTKMPMNRARLGLMSASDDNNDIIDRAEDLYVARSVIAAKSTRRPLLAIADLVRFLTDLEVSLTPDQQAQLFTDRQLRDDFQRLKRSLSLFVMPAAAAASTDQLLNERNFPGAQVKITASRKPDHFYVIIALEEVDSSPALLVLESPAGDIARVALPEVDDRGTILILKDMASPSDARLINLLRDPSTIGTFIR